jgi:hypothetical protein
MKSGIEYFRIKLLQQFLEATARSRSGLLTDLVNKATDPVIVMRRFRMLRQLAEYESQIVAKIQNFDTDDILDFSRDFIYEIQFITNYSS